MIETLQYFRPGEEVRMIPRCQFTLDRQGRCCVILTYPIKGFPWRRNPLRVYEFKITPELAAELFNEVGELEKRFPNDCLPDKALWSDHSERGANAVTRDAHGVTCHTLYICSANGYTPYYSMREDSVVLLNSRLFKIIHQLINSYETLPTSRA